MTRRLFLVRAASAISIAACGGFTCGVANAAAVGDLSGDFRGGHGSYQFAKDGTFVWDGEYFGGTDAGIRMQLRGRVTVVEDYFEAVIDPESMAHYWPKDVPDDFPLRARNDLYLRRVNGHDFLLTDANIIAIANQVNSSGNPNIDAAFLTRRVVARNAPFDRIMTTAGQLLPQYHQRYLLVHPLTSTVMRIGPVSGTTINMAGWMRPQQLVTQHSALLTIDINGNDRAFAGMTLFVGHRGVAASVRQVRELEADLLYRWVTSGEPRVGMPVTSQLHPQR